MTAWLPGQMSIRGCLRDGYLLSATMPFGILMVDRCDARGPSVCVPGRGTWALIDQNGDHLSQDGHINVWRRSGQGFDSWLEGSSLEVISITLIC